MVNKQVSPSVYVEYPQLEIKEIFGISYSAFTAILLFCLFLIWVIFIHPSKEENIEEIEISQLFDNEDYLGMNLTNIDISVIEKCQPSSSFSLHGRINAPIDITIYEFDEYDSNSLLAYFSYTEFEDVYEFYGYKDKNNEYYLVDIKEDNLGSVLKLKKNKGKFDCILTTVEGDTYNGKFKIVK